LPEAAPVIKGYNDEVRFYTTKTVNGGTTFTCVFCDYSVTTLDFDHTQGNRRTQAASAMNQHATELHGTRVRELAPTKVNSY
jgi:hypothetical protein